MKNTCVAMVLFTLLFSCKKESTPMPPPALPPNPPTIQALHVPGANAVLQSTYLGTLREEFQIGTYTFFEGSARAWFADNDAPARVMQAVCEGHLLERDGDMYYSHGSGPYGIDFGSSVQWEVTGQGNVPNFNFEVPHKVPEIGNIKVGDSISIRDTVWLKIDLGSPFTFLGQVDSIRLCIKSAAYEYNFVLGGPTDSAALSPAQLASCGKGMAYISAEAFKTTKKSHQGYPVAFVNQGMFHKPVWLY